ncbi:cell division protein SepF [Pectinatus haikarae]|uniref:Cell division protein SepF n=1 Tax=Pectinatus haikarae TaxID=349096 RepID=A0ABT9Y5A7_9FIRM|nr:cell division protein SepF [Pectinatus haikarae]MDQ0203014.1 cell division inhibitor SepF [Pectinatus haikarae]
MSFFDKFGSKMGLTDDKDKNRGDSRNRQMDPESDEYEEYEDSPVSQDNVVDFQSVAANSAGNSSGIAGRQMKVIIIEPASFDDAQQIAEHIKARKPVVLNFENTNDETAKRIIDFISGATYALAGDIKKVGQHIFLCAPNNVNVTFSDAAASKPVPPRDDKLPWE